MYSINSMNTLMFTNTTWAMWHQQYHNTYRRPISIYQRLNTNSFINYRPHKNEWSVQFSNVRYNLSIYQIYKIFGSYGKVNVVQRPGFDRTVYVNYETEIDAKRCVMGIIQQGFINLRVFPKNQNFNPRDNSKSTINHDDNLENVYSVKNDVINVNSGNLSSSDSSFTYDSSSENTSDETPVKTNLIKELSGQTPEEFLDKFKENNSSKLSENSSKIGGDKLISGKSVLSENATGEKLEIPTTIVRNSRGIKPQMIIEAQEVIVANIPEAFGVFYILHLLEKFEPICCSEIKTLENNSIRYCHVYFETTGDAEAAETDFDNVELTGRNLIVMRPHTLVEEAEK